MGSRRGVPVTLRMDQDIVNKLEAMAEEDRRTRTAQVEWLVEQEVERRKREGA